jgi:HEAT repeat protein
MTLTVALGVIAIAQVILVVLLLAFLWMRRSYNARIRVAVALTNTELQGPLREWLLEGGTSRALMARLREMPREAAVGCVALLARLTIPPAYRDELRRALREEPWVREALQNWSHRRWWKRLEAARALSLTATPADRAIVLALYEDTHPGVQVAAASALPLVIDDTVVIRVLDRIDVVPKVVRQFVTIVLRTCSREVGPLLASRLLEGQRVAELASCIELAEAIDHPEAIGAARRLAAHPAVPIRRTVARALRRDPSPEATAAAIQLLADPDASVRSAAARTLGQLGSRSAISALSIALSDPVWIVRLRSAVALAQSGESGRAALRLARESGDRYARETATMVGGLSDGALLDLGNA